MANKVVGGHAPETNPAPQHDGNTNGDGAPDAAMMASEMRRLARDLQNAAPLLYDTTLQELLTQMPSEARHDLLRRFRSPRFAPGGLKDHPALPAVEAALQDEKEVEKQEAAS